VSESENRKPNERPEVNNTHSRFGGWDFADGFASARCGTEEIKFTRAERALLNVFTKNSGRVLSRDALLDKISGEGSEVGDRSVDFLINRLRRKLGDPARKPSFIATQYGEGYVWIAAREPASEEHSEAEIIVGPIRGLPPVGPLREDGLDFAERLAKELNRQSGPDMRVALSINGAPTASKKHLSTPLGISLDFLSGSEGLIEMAIAVRTLPGGALKNTRRVRLDDMGRSETAGKEKPLTDLADRILHDGWQGLSYQFGSAAPEDKPLAVRLHEAATLLAENSGAGEESEKLLRAAILAEPDNFHNHIMLATSIHSRMLVQGLFSFSKTEDWNSCAREIEHLVLTALPRIQDNDLLVLAAAKLLWFSGKTHRQLAIDLAEDAFSATTAFGSAFATVGQLRMWDGRGEEAIELFDRAAAFAGEDFSHFSRYLLTLKAEALLSIGEFEQANANIGKFYPKNSTDFDPLRLFFDCGQPGASFPESEFQKIGEAGARASLHYAYLMIAQHFADPLARRFVLSRPVQILTSRFGAAILPDEVRKDLDRGTMADSNY